MPLHLRLECPNGRFHCSLNMCTVLADSIVPQNLYVYLLAPDRNIFLLANHGTSCNENASVSTVIQKEHRVLFYYKMSLPNNYAWNYLDKTRNINKTKKYLHWKKLFLRTIYFWIEIENIAKSRKRVIRITHRTSESRMNLRISSEWLKIESTQNISCCCCCFCHKVTYIATPTYPIGPNVALRT